MQKETQNTTVFPRAERYLLGITIIWGSTFSITKHALSDISPLMLQGVRFALAAVFVGMYSYKDIRATTARSLRAGVILGILLGTGFAFQTLGLATTSASKAGFLTGTLVVFTPLLQLAIERRMPAWGNLLGVLLVAVGLYIFNSPQGEAFSTGDLLVLVCAVIFALHVVYIDVFTKERFDQEIVFYQFAVTSAIGFIAALFVPGKQTVVTANVVWSVLYLSFFASAFALYILSKYQREISPTRAAIIYTLEPVMAAVIAYLSLGERLSATATVGAAVMFAGLLATELHQYRRSRRRAATGSPRADR